MADILTPVEQGLEPTSFFDVEEVGGTPPPLFSLFSTASERLPVHRSVSCSWAIERPCSTGNMYLLHHV